MLAFLVGLATALKIIAGILTSAVFYKFVVVPVRDGLRRLKSIGDNGHETIFEMLHRLSDQQAIQGSLQDLIDSPMFMTDKTGQIVSANIACSRLLGWNVDDLRFGGWRSKLDRDAQVQWDEAVSQKAIFERTVSIMNAAGAKVPVTILLKPIWNQDKHLGWRGVIDREAA